MARRRLEKTWTRPRFFLPSVETTSTKSKSSSAQIPITGATGLFFYALRLAQHREAKAMSKLLLPKGGGKTRRQFCETYGISERNRKRLQAANDIPRLTWITPNKPIVRPQHEQEWLDARTDPAPEPSPFPSDEN